MRTWLYRYGPKRLLAPAANLLLRRRAQDRRRFAVDEHGNWVNRQPEATFVSPDVHTATFAQIREAILDNWSKFYLPRAGDIVIDVGAGIGEDAIIFSDLVGTSGRVIAIEAHPRTFACLEATIRASGRANIEPMGVAIASEDGALSIEDGAHLSNSVMTGHGQIQVAAYSLDSLVDRLNLQRVDLLKMNIEGAERPALEGLRRAARCVRNAAISCHDFVADAGGPEELRTRRFVIDALVDLGFEVTTRSDSPHAWCNDVIFARRR